MTMRPRASRLRPAARAALGAIGSATLLALGGCSTAESAAPPPTLTVAARGGSTPTVARDPRSGASYVAWVDTGDSTANVHLARSGPDGWLLGEPVRVNATPGDASTHEQAPPQVAVGPAGEVYVVWQRSYSVPGRMYAASDLRFARSTDGGRSFGSTLTVNDDAGGPPASHTFHDVAVARDGTVYVAWLDSRETDRARAALGAPGGGNADGAELPGSEIRLASLRPGDTGFGPSTVVDGDVCPCCRVSLAVGGQGQIYVAWRKVYAGNVRDVVVARSEDGGRSFAPPVPVHRDGWVYEGCPHAGPSIALDAEGRLHAAWYTGREGRQGLHHAVSSDGARSFAAPQALLADEWVPPSQVKLTGTPEGVFAAWDDRRGEQRRTHLARLEDDGPSALGEPIPGHSPSIASAGGAISVVWLEGSAVRARLYTPE